MIAPLALILWPFVTVLFFRALPLAAAVAATILGGYLLLPGQTGLDLPLLPSLNKTSIPALCAVIGTIAVLSRTPDPGLPEGWWPRGRLVNLCLALLFVGIVGTVLTNGDNAFSVSSRGRGLRPYDALSDLLRAATGLLGFFVARKVFATPATMRQLIGVLAVAAVCYACLALVEIRLSPQLNRWVYGFFPHSWIQHLRGSGYRPLVFLSHGLMLAIFFATAFTAVAALARRDGHLRGAFAAAAGFILVVMVLSNSLGALLIAFFMLGVILVLPVRLQILAAAAIAGLVLAYPMMRAVDLVPTDRVLSVAATISETRAASLRFRMAQEDALLARAAERPVFGWGGWGRSRILNEDGRDVSITDGYWIIEFGQSGWTGYLARFGLLCGGILALAFQRRFAVDAATAAVALALAANLVDLIPNAGVSALTLCLAGALFGRLELGDIRSAAAGAGSRPVRGQPVLRREFEPRQGGVARPGRDTSPVRLRRDPDTARLGRDTPPRRPGYHRPRPEPERGR